MDVYDMTGICSYAYIRQHWDAQNPFSHKRQNITPDKDDIQPTSRLENGELPHKLSLLRNIVIPI